MTSISESASVAVGVGAKAKTVANAAVFVTMSLLGLALSTRSLNHWDESWFLEVIARMRDGEALYRDISYGAGPLPAYLAEAMTYLVGVDVLAEKLVVVLTFAATATLAWLVAEHLGLGLKGRLIVLAGIFYFSPPLQEPPYAPLATAFVLAALLAALVFRAAQTPRARTAASLAGGAVCGLAFVCKQNVGVYGFVAFALVLLLDRQVKKALFALGTFLASAGVVLLPVVFSGGFARYVDYGYTGKGEYLASGVSFRAGLDGILQTFRDVRGPASAEAAYWAGRFFLPCLAVAGLVAVAIAVRRRRTTPVVVPLLVFAAAAAATLFPRFDQGHVAWSAPILLLVLAYALHLWRAAVPRVAWLVAALWLGVGIASAATLPLRLIPSPVANLSELPHHRGAFVHPDDLSRWRREGAQLAAAARGRPDGLLLLVPDAGFRYLTSGLKNPTPFDFPFVTTFGRDGQERVIGALSAGRIERVCLGPDWFGYEPERLVTYVRSTMRRDRTLDICTLYVRTD